MDPLLPGDPENVGPYRLEGRLGEGGMGQVFLGSSPAGRKVAVKIIRPEHAGNAQFRARFAREGEAARRVGGFHTAQVVDADPEADPPWLVTAYVDGPSLLELVKDRGPMDPGAVWTLGAGLAEGLAAIHGCGLVHRDLKPGNVIMAGDGPRIIDFGIARDADASTLTATGMVVGTFAFMSPEQVRAEPATSASDVFALGCVLAYAAAGRGPFDAGTIPAIVHRIVNEPPRLDGITGPLLEVIGACLAKDPAERAGVPDLVTRFGTPGAPHAPHAPNTPHVLNVPGGPPPAPQGPGGPPPPGGPPHAGAPAFGPPRPVAPAPVPRRLLLIGAAAATGLAATAGTLAFRFWPESEEKGPPARGGAAPAKGTDPAVLQGPRGPDAVAFSQDGKTIAAVGSDGAIWLWDVATGRNLSVGHIPVPKYVQPVLFSPDLKMVVRAEEKTIKVWNATTSRIAQTFTGHKEHVKALAFSPDGKSLAASSGKEPVRIRALAGGGGGTVKTHIGWVDAVAFSPDGKILAFGNNNHSELLREGSGASIATLKWSRANTLAFSPDGETLAIGGIDGNVDLCDVGRGRVTATLGKEAMFGKTGMVYSLAFSPDGKTLVSAHKGPGTATVRVWDLATRRVKRTLANASPPVMFSPDGRTLAAAAYTGLGGGTGGVQLWKAP